MISAENFEKATPQLRRQLNLNKDASTPTTRKFLRTEWDTYVGWKSRNRKINRGEKGYTVRITVPLKYQGSDSDKPLFRTEKKTLFAINQTTPKEKNYEK